MRVDCPPEGIFGQFLAIKTSKNNAIVTTCALDGVCIVLIMNDLFFDCTIIGAIDREGGWGGAAFLRVKMAFPWSFP